MRDRPHPRVAAHWPASRHGNLSRYRLLRDIVEEHRRDATARGAEPRDRDERLYRRLEEIERSLPVHSRAGGART